MFRNLQHLQTQRDNYRKLLESIVNDSDDIVTRYNLIMLVNETVYDHNLNKYWWQKRLEHVTNVQEAEKCLKNLH